MMGSPIRSPRQTPKALQKQKQKQKQKGSLRPKQKVLRSEQPLHMRR
jgi:hypothetical protein